MSKKKKEQSSQEQVEYTSNHSPMPFYNNASMIVDVDMTNSRNKPSGVGAKNSKKDHNIK